MAPYIIVSWVDLGVGVTYGSQTGGKSKGTKMGTQKVGNPKNIVCGIEAEFTYVGPCVPVVFFVSRQLRTTSRLAYSMLRALYFGVPHFTPFKVTI